MYYAQKLAERGLGVGARRKETFVGEEKGEEEGESRGLKGFGLVVECFVKCNATYAGKAVRQEHHPLQTDWVVCDVHPLSAPVAPLYMEEEEEEEEKEEKEKKKEEEEDEDDSVRNYNYCNSYQCIKSARRPKKEVHWVAFAAAVVRLDHSPLVLVLSTAFWCI